MSVLGWILAGVLAAFFLAAGMAKLTSSREKLLENPTMAWANDFTEPQIKVISTLEVLGAVGLVLPWLLDVAPALTPIAAIGLGLTMIGAFFVNLRRKEFQGLPVNAVVFALAIVLSVIRFTQI